MILVVMDPTVKYHSVSGHTLTCSEKTNEDSIWWVVLVGRYPWARERKLVCPSHGASRGSAIYPVASQKKQIRGLMISDYCKGS